MLCIHPASLGRFTELCVCGVLISFKSQLFNQRLPEGELSSKEQGAPNLKTIVPPGGRLPKFEIVCFFVAEL